MKKNNKKTANILGERIKEERKKLNLSQAELAEKIYLSDKMISAYERGNSIPPLDTIITLSDLFKISIDDLVKEKKEKPPLDECISELLKEKSAKEKEYAYTVLECLLNNTKILME